MIGEELRAIRKLYNKTQEDVARDLCVTSRMYKRYEYGESCMSASMIALLKLRIAQWKMDRVKELEDKINIIYLTIDEIKLRDI